MIERYSTGNEDLDKILGGGLIKGTKTIIYGPAGIGKTILGVSIAHEGIKEDKYPGLIVNNGSSMDDQMQTFYAKNFFDWDLKLWKSNETDIYKKTCINSSVSWGLRWMDEEDSSNHEFFVFHLPRTKRVILDDLLSNQVKTVNEFFKVYDKTEEFVITDRSRRWSYFASQEDLAEAQKHPNGRVHYFLRSKTFRKDTEVIKKAIKMGILVRDKDSFVRNNTNSNFNEDNRRIYIDDARGRFLKPAGPLMPNIREEFFKKDHSFVINLTTDNKNIFEIVNGPVINRELDAGVNTIIALGYLPSSLENMKQESAIAVLKHRGSSYDKGIFNYEMTDKGFNIKL
jgi:KaiC/GvpD/RAD55 family RecA-like ATPase